MVSERENGKRGNATVIWKRERRGGLSWGGSVEFSKGHSMSSPPSPPILPSTFCVTMERRASFICYLITSGAWYVKNLPPPYPRTHAHISQGVSCSSLEEQDGGGGGLEYANSGNNSTAGPCPPKRWLPLRWAMVGGQHGGGGDCSRED